MDMEIKPMISQLKRYISTLKYASQDKDDLLQEVLLKVLRSKTFRADYSNGWLYFLVRSCVIDAHRRKKRDRGHDSAYIDMAGQVCEGGGEGEDNENYVTNVIYNPIFFDEFHDVAPDDLEEIPEILASLSDVHQEVLLMYANGLNYSQIADATGERVGTVRSRLHYARKHAHQILETKMKEENEKGTVLLWNRRT